MRDLLSGPKIIHRCLYVIQVRRVFENLFIHYYLFLFLLSTPVYLFFHINIYSTVGSQSSFRVQLLDRSFQLRCFFILHIQGTPAVIILPSSACAIHRFFFIDFLNFTKIVNNFHYFSGTWRLPSLLIFLKTIFIFISGFYSFYICLKFLNLSEEIIFQR